MDDLGCKISIVILTYNRPDRVLQHLSILKNINYSSIEIIIVDNGSVDSIASIVCGDSRVKVVVNEKNLGSVGRNVGMALAKGEIVITLDDDVFGITDDDILEIIKIFENKEIGAVVFKVVEEFTGKIINWCHPKDKEKFKDIEFETSEISEGAVAFRNECLKNVGLYTEYFFISHEGPDLAIRIIGIGKKIIYSPKINVIHAYDNRERPGWRRYYYDTRNLLWLVLRNYPFVYGMKKLFIGWASLFIYSIRDGYLKVYVKAIFCAVGNMGRPFSERKVPGAETFKKIKIIESDKPGFFKMVKERLFSKEVKI